MALMQLTVTPLGTGTPSVGDYVADIQKALTIQGVNYKLTDMGTIIEGETEHLLALASKLSNMPFEKGIKRVVTQIVLDDRRDKIVGLGDKTTSVLDRLK